MSENATSVEGFEEVVEKKNCPNCRQPKMEAFELIGRKKPSPDFPALTNLPIHIGMMIRCSNCGRGIKYLVKFKELVECELFGVETFGESD
jgi:uncharacterized Zn finger protein